MRQRICGEIKLQPNAWVAFKLDPILRDATLLLPNLEGSSGQ